MGIEKVFLEKKLKDPIFSNCENSVFAMKCHTHAQFHTFYHSDLFKVDVLVVFVPALSVESLQPQVICKHYT